MPLLKAWPTASLNVGACEVGWLLRFGQRGSGFALVQKHTNWPAGVVHEDVLARAKIACGFLLESKIGV